jgi:serine/threonine protein kinase
MAVPSVRNVFENALEFASDEDRRAYLDRVCAGAPDLQLRVEALLRADKKSVGIVDRPAAELLASQPGSQATQDHVPAAATPSEAGGETPAEPRKRKDPKLAAEARLGEIVAGYRLTGVLGVGGMGAVFLGEKRDGQDVHRVAIKLIQHDKIDAHFMARFKAERRILTRLNHGNIAKVFDMGAHVVEKSGSQEPYFVMENVADEESPGLTLDEYCTKHTLTIRERLELFEAVCRGVDHAHSSGVVHRDLKGLNILVAVPKNGRPVPKVIDFGLAMAIEEEVEAGIAMGTWDYMSPEQAAGDAGIGPRTDVFALGVVLYKLLTGVVPIDVGGVKGYEERIKLIRNEPVEPPSSKVKKLELAKVAAERRIEPSQLPKVLRSDLDWVVAQALAKDSADRYATAGALGDEIRRFLDGAPVNAGPPSPLVRAKKFARRNRAMVTAGSVVLFTLILAIAGLAYGLVTVNAAKNSETAARRDLEEAEKSQGKALQISWDLIRVRLRLEKALDAKELLLYRNMFKELSPLVRDYTGESRIIRATDAGLRFLIGDVAAILEMPEAERYYNDAIARYESLNADFPDTPEYTSELAKCHFDRAHLRWKLKRTFEAESDLHTAARYFEAVIALEPGQAAYRRELADTWNDLGVRLRIADKLPEAEAVLRKAVEQGEKAIELGGEYAPYRVNLAMSYHNLGNVVRDQGKAKESIKEYDRAYTVLGDGTAENAARTLVYVLWDRATAKVWLKQFEGAFADWDEAWKLNETGKFFTAGELALFREAAQVEKKFHGKIPDNFAYAIAKLNARAFSKATGEDTLQQQYADRAFELLTQAKAAGWFRDEKVVEAFRADEDFKKLPPERLAVLVSGLSTPKK